jgi:hypothetical protein
METNPLDTSWKHKEDAGDVARVIPIIGDIYAGSGVRTKQEKDKQTALERALQMMMQYRPEQIQTRQNAIDSAMQLFGPVNNALVEAYGENARLPIQEASQNPFGDKAMAEMVAQASPKKR